MTVDDDTIDLRPYLLTIWKYKWWIFLLAVLMTAIVTIYTQTQPDLYSSKATLLLTRSRPVLSLAQQFPTVNEPVDSRSRMDAILTIAESDAIIQQTIATLSEKLPEKMQTIDALKDRLSIESKGDSIIVSASAEDPELAAEITNAWANRIVETINTAYSGEQPLIEIQQQLTTAKSDYETAQAELEAFIAQNPLKSLEQKYNELHSMLNLLGSDKAVQMEQLIKRKQTMQELSFQTEALIKQLEGGARSTAGAQGDALAVILARMRALGIQRTTTSANQSLPPSGADLSQQPEITFPNIANISQPVDLVLNLQIDGTNNNKDGAADYVADIEALSKLLQDEITRTESAIQSLSEEVVETEVSPDKPIDNIAARLQELATEIEKVKSKEKELTDNRDLKQRAYQALVQKETEIKNAALTSNQINLASPAIPPLTPESSGLLQKAAIAGMLGVLIGIIWAIFREWWKSTP